MFVVVFTLVPTEQLEKEGQKESTNDKPKAEVNGEEDFEPQADDLD